MDWCPKIVTTSSANRIPLKPVTYSTRNHSTGAIYYFITQSDAECWN